MSNMISYKHRILVLLLLFPFFQSASPLDIKEEEINIESAYKYTLDNVDKAKAIIQIMRERRLYPTYTLNRVEGIVYFNRADYIESVKFLKRALFDKDIDGDIPQKLSVLNMLMYSYYYLHNIPSMEYYVQKLYELAEKSDYQNYLSAAVFGKGLVNHAKCNKIIAYKHFRESIRILENIDSPQAREDLFYRYLSLLEHQQEDNLNTEALQTIQTIEAYQASRDSSETTNDPLNDIHLKDFLAHCTVIYQRLGHPEKAANYYKQFIETANMYQNDYKCIEPYLYEMKLYDDIIRFSDARKFYLKSIADTMNYEMISISEMSARAYAAKGEYEKASADYAKIISLYEQIKRSEESSIMNELTSNYELNEKALSMERQTSAMKIQSVLFVMFLLFLMIAFVIYRTVHYNRIITHKNELMSKRIDELMRYKDNLYERKTQREEKRNEVKRGIFERMQHYIIKEQLYLNPNLSREMLMDKFNISKNEFSSMFQDSIGISYTQYINEFRLEHAIKLIKKYPSYTIDAIAKESGFYSPTSLYRLFCQKYGMTPSEYRAMLNKTKDQKEECVVTRSSEDISS